MSPYPWYATFVEKEASYQLIVIDKDEGLVALLEFYDVDTVMRYILSFSNDILIVRNRYDLMNQVQKYSQIPYVFWKNGKINKSETAKQMYESGNFPTVASIIDATGMSGKFIHEILSRIRPKNSI